MGRGQVALGEGAEGGFWPLAGRPRIENKRVRSGAEANDGQNIEK